MWGDPKTKSILISIQGFSGTSNNIYNLALIAVPLET